MRAAKWIGMVAAVYLAGCSGATQEDYVPQAEPAKAALTAALDAWKAGQPPDKITTAEPAVQPVDTQWKGGAKLQSYEILEQVPAASPTRFKVKLTLPADAGGVQDAEYVIVGQDPLWVWRDKDYNQVEGQEGM